MLSGNAGHEYRDAVRDILDFLFGGVVVMSALDMEMAAHVHERLAKMDPTSRRWHFFYETFLC